MYTSPEPLERAIQPGRTPYSFRSPFQLILIGERCSRGWGVTRSTTLSRQVTGAVHGRWQRAAAHQAGDAIIQLDAVILVKSSSSRGLALQSRSRSRQGRLFGRNIRSNRPTADPLSPPARCLAFKGPPHPPETADPSPPLDGEGRTTHPGIWTGDGRRPTPMIAAHGQATGSSPPLRRPVEGTPATADVESAAPDGFEVVSRRPTGDL